MLNNAFHVAHLNLPSEAFNSTIHVKKTMLNNAFRVAHLNLPSEAFNSSIHRQKSHVEQCVSCCTSKSTIRGIQFHYTREKSHVEQCVSCCTSRSTSMQYQPFIHQKHSIPVYTCKKAMLNNAFHVAPLVQPACSISHSSIRGLQFQYTPAKKPC